MRSVAIVTRQLAKNTGATRNTHEQIRLFRRLGFEVDVYGEFVDKRRVRESGGRPHRVSGWPCRGVNRRLVFARRVAGKLRDRGHDLVLGHGDIMEQDVLFLHNCVHLTHEAVHGEVLPASHEMARIHGRLLGGRHFKLLVANSYKMKEDVEERFGLKSESVEVVYPGYDPEQFNLEDRAGLRQRFRARLGVAEDQVLVGLVTSGSFLKRNVQLFLRACGGMSDETASKARFLVVGKGKVASRLEAVAREAGIGDRYLGVIEPVREVQEVFHALDVSVLPARWEEFGRVVLEAMACGLPVVVSDRVGASELLEGESRNLIVPADDRGALGETLRGLSSDPEARRRLGRLNAQIAARYSERKQADKLVEVLEKHRLI